MKNLLVWLGMGIVFSNSASATTYTWQPKDIDLEDLDHTKAYQWAIQWNVPANEQIQNVTLTFFNIYDWTAEADDRLWLKVLDYDNKGDFQSRWNIVHIPTLVGHPFRFISDSHSNSKRTPVPIDIGQGFRFHIGHFFGVSECCPISSEGCPTCLGTVSELVGTH